LGESGLSRHGGRHIRLELHARALDVDTKAPCATSTVGVGTSILFESSGGQIDKMAHLPELRFALGEPEVDTTSVDTAALALEGKSFFIRRVGSDGFKISHQPTMKKVVSDRRASLDEDSEIKRPMRKLVQKEFEDGASVPMVLFPADGTAIRIRQIDPGDWRTGFGMDRLGSASLATGGMDPPTGQVPPSLSRSLDLVPE
jgi:hypothetical protein